MTQHAPHPAIVTFNGLPADERRKALTRLAQLSQQVWHEFTARKGRIRYRDSVVGMSHELDQSLPDRAIEAIVGLGDSKTVADGYLEPVAALQDMDLELPERVEFAFYAIYNLFRKYCQHEQIDESLILKQILSSLPGEAAIEEALRHWP